MDQKLPCPKIFYFFSCGDMFQMSGVIAKYLLEEINRTERGAFIRMYKIIIANSYGF